MASCLNQNRNPATTSTDQNANITLEDCMCPICLSILIEPVSLPCKHVLCMPCFRSNIEETSMCCPMCRVRIATWSRQAARKKRLVDEERWNQIKRLFPEQVQKRLDGDDDDEDLRASSRASSCRLAEPGEIRREYEAELKKVAEEENERKKAELAASEALMRQLQEEELRKVNRWKEENDDVLRKDEEIARQLEAALRQEHASPPGIRTTRNRPPTLLDKFVSRGKKTASCEPTPPTRSDELVRRSSSAGLVFPCSKSRTKQKRGLGKKSLFTNTTKAANSTRTRVVVDSQEPSTSASYNHVQKPDVKIVLESKPLVQSVSVKMPTESSGSVLIPDPNVSEYLQGSDNLIPKMDAEVINVEGKLCVAGDVQKLSMDSQNQKHESYHVQGLNLEKTCANLAEHIYNKPSGQAYHTLSSSNSGRSSSGYSPLLIDETLARDKGFDSPVPDVMLSSCANMSDASAIKSPSVKEIIVLSSDSEISRENSVVATFMSIPVIDISDSSENNTPVPSTSAAAASGDAKCSSRSLSVTVERLPTPSFALLHQTPEDEPCTSSQGKQPRSASVESCDSISHELVHFKPIQICPRTPPKRLPNGKVVVPPFVVSTPRNLTKRFCSSPPVSTMPQAADENSPLVKKRLQTLAAERLQEVKLHSKGIETDPDLIPNSNSQVKSCTGSSNIRLPNERLAQATKTLRFDDDGDRCIRSNDRKHLAKLTDFIEQSRMENFTLPESFHVSAGKKSKSSVFEVPVEAVERKLSVERKFSRQVPEILTREKKSQDCKKTSSGRVYNMRRNKKRIKLSQDNSPDGNMKKSSGDLTGTPPTTCTIKDWILNSQEKIKKNVKNIAEVSQRSTCAPPVKRLCTGVVYQDRDGPQLHQVKVRGRDSQLNAKDTVQIGKGGKNTQSKLKNSKQSSNQVKLDFTRQQRLISECDSDGSSNGKCSTRRKQNKQTRTQVKHTQKRHFSEVEQSQSDSSVADDSDDDADLEEMDRNLALQLQEQFNYEAKNNVTMYCLRGGRSQEYSFRRRARSAVSANSKVS